jgi:Tfp pilus assembly protein PilF
MSSKSDWRLWVTVLYGLGLGIIPLSAGAETGAPPASQKVTAPASDLPALYEQAQQAQQKGEQDKAIALLTQILERDPQQIEAYEARASLYEKQKRSELAMADYRKIIALDPKHTGAQGNLGWLLILDNRFDEAREATEKAHALAPDDYAWLFNLGHLALFAGQQEQARTYYRQALERIPSTEGFEQSIVADFDLFIQKGWQVEKIKQALAWARETFAPRKNW